MRKQGDPGKALAVILLVLYAGGFAGSPIEAADKPFVLALLGKDSFPPISPPEAYTTQSLSIEAQILEGLVCFDPQNPEKLVPLLASQYFVIDPRTYVFRLRKDAYFHPFPGHPREVVTAADVKFSLELARSSKGALSYLLEDIEYIQAVGRDLVKIKLRQPNNSFLSILATSVGHVLPKEYFDSLGKDDASRLAAFGQAPVGTGPYRLLGPVAPNEKTAVLERFASYHDREWARSPAAVSPVVLRLYKDPEEIVKGLLSGDIAMTSLPLTEYANGVDFSSWKGTFITLEPPFLTLLAINTQKPRLSDPKVRQLLNAAVDKEKVARICPLDPKHLPASFIPFMEILKEEPGNAEKKLGKNEELSRLLAEPGMTKLKSGLLSSGPFVILASDRRDHVVDELLASVAEDLRRNLGLTVNIKRQPGVSRQVVASLQPDLTYVEWTPDTPWEQGDLAILEPLFKSTSESNRALYKDSTIDQYFADAKRVNDRNSNETFCKKIQLRLREAAPLIWLPSVRHRTLLLTSRYQLGYLMEVQRGSVSSLVYFTSFLKNVRIKQ
jgi:peptide/nickel transport system substrate-binding protein